MSEDSLRPGPRPYTVHVLYDHPVVLDLRAVEERLSRRRPGALAVPPDANGIATFRHPERVHLREGDEPILGARGERLVLRDPLHASLACTPAMPISLSAADLAQTWDWPGGRDAAGATLARCSHAIALTEMTSVLLRVPTRIDAVVDTLAAIVETHPPLGTFWGPIERFDEPQAFLETAADAARRVHAMVNVRLFNVAGAEPGAMVMDTLGLTMLGLLADLQAHFVGLDPGRIAGYLQDVTAYLVDRAATVDGPLLADGDVLPAPAPDPYRWRVRHEMALMKPTRGVFDLDTGTVTGKGTRPK